MIKLVRLEASEISIIYNIYNNYQFYLNNLLCGKYSLMKQESPNYGNRLLRDGVKQVYFERPTYSVPSLHDNAACGHTLP